VRTHPVDKLLEQHCYKSAAGLLQLVRFYVCNPIELILKSFVDENFECKISSDISKNNPDIDLYTLPIASA
jgi:hypothetical protein